MKIHLSYLISISLLIASCAHEERVFDDSSIDREGIRKTIRDNMKLFQGCYDEALKRKSDLFGKIEIIWVIEEKGRVTKSSVKSNSSGDKKMGECVVHAIKTLTFPEPAHNLIAEVVYPFIFTVTDDDRMGSKQ